MRCTIPRTEVAKELGISPLRVTALIEQGKLPGIVDNSSVRTKTIIIREQWEAWKARDRLAG